MNSLPGLLTNGARPSGHDPLSELLATLWDIEMSAVVIAEIRQKAQQAEQQPTEVQTPAYDARKLTSRGFVD